MCPPLLFYAYIDCEQVSSMWMPFYGHILYEFHKTEINAQQQQQKMDQIVGNNL